MQLEVKAQVGEHVRLREMQREHQLAVEEAKREQEREQRRMANREIEKFRQRVSLALAYLSDVRLAGCLLSHNLCC